MSTHLMGGKSESVPVSAEGRELAERHRADMQSRLGANFSTFEPVEQRTQVVAGTNYFLKIRTGDNEFVHARIWSKLDRTSSLEDISGGKSREDAI